MGKKLQFQTRDLLCRTMIERIAWGRDGMENKRGKSILASGKGWIVWGTNEIT